MTSRSNMDADNLKEHHGNIDTAKVNGISRSASLYSMETCLIMTYRHDPQRHFFVKQIPEMP